MRLLFVLLLAATACGAPSRPEVVVFAAASARAPLTVIGQGFEDAAVVYNFGGSDGLARAIERTGGADVFVSADVALFDGLTDFTAPRVFAQNAMTIIVPTENPAGIRSLADLARPAVVLVLAGEQVPAGAYARTILHRADAGAALNNVVSNEVDVSGVVAKVAAGEVDAGIVYRTDVVTGVSAIDIPAEQNVIASYGIASRIGSVVGASFVERVLASTDVFARAGFLVP